MEWRTQLPAVAASAAQARSFALSALAEWDLSDLRDTVSLLVTELISNGVRHAKTTLELILRFDDVSLRVAVADGDLRPPITQARHGLTVGGWGLALIESLSTQWGTDIDDARGKTVWFEIATTRTSHSWPKASHPQQARCPRDARRTRPAPDSVAW